MPIITAEEFSKKKLTDEQRYSLRNLRVGLENISRDDTSTLKEDSGLVKIMGAIGTLLNPLSGINAIKNALETLTGLSDYLKDGSEFNTNYHAIKYDGERNDNNLNPEQLEKGLKTLQEVTGIEIKNAKIEDAQNEKIIHAGDLNIDPASRLMRPVVTSEISNIDGIKNVAKIGKNFMDPGCLEYNSVEKMLNDLKDTSERIQTYLNTQKDFNQDSGFEYEENVKLKNKIDEFREAVITVRKAGAADTEVTDEQADKALGIIKAMPEFLMGSFEKTNYQRLKDFNCNENTLTHGMEALEKSLKNGIDMNTVSTALAKKNLSIKANESIEAAQKYIGKNKTAFMSNSDLFKQTITRIMATRMAVNSELGKGKTLNVMTDVQNRYKVEQQLLGNKHFQDFLSNISQDPNKVKVALSAACKGHGGGLDKMFTAYLKTRPAGELNNDPAISRFMPTVKDRIEYLQSQASAFYGKERTAPVEEIAEIVALREISKAERNRKSLLMNKIPTDASLSEKTKKYAHDAQFGARCQSRSVLEFFNKGHGGEMQKNMENMKKVAEEANAKPNPGGPHI